MISAPYLSPPNHKPKSTEGQGAGRESKGARGGGSLGRLLRGNLDDRSQLSQVPPRSEKLVAWNGNGRGGESRIVNQNGLLANFHHDQGMQTLRLPVMQRTRRDDNDRWNAFL